MMCQKNIKGSRFCFLLLAKINFLFHFSVDRLSSSQMALRRFFANLNLFESGSVDPDTIRQEKITTRVYLVVFALSIIGLVFYAAISLRTVQNPSFNGSIHVTQTQSNVLVHVLLYPIANSFDMMPLFMKSVRVNSFPKHGSMLSTLPTVHSSHPMMYE